MRILILFIFSLILGGCNSPFRTNESKLTQEQEIDSSSESPDSNPQTTIKSSITQHGITWTFSKQVTVGQFVNGDYYVVGDVTITNIDPLPAHDRNGSVLNLPVNIQRTGFDSRTEGNRYDKTLRANLPINMKAGDSLISTISVDTVGAAKRVMRTLDATVSPVKSASVLTSLSAPVSPDAFRPSYCDKNNKIYFSKNLRRNLLPKLAKVSCTPDIKTFEGYFQRPWIDTLYFGFDAPIDYMPDYGREVARVVAHASLLLMLDYSDQEKEKLLINFVQYGIDLHGAVEAGHSGWSAHGGHGNGRKLPIIFAGILLNETKMKSPAGSYSEDAFVESMWNKYR